MSKILHVLYISHPLFYNSYRIIFPFSSYENKDSFIAFWEK